MSHNKPIVIPGEISAIRTLKDRSVKIELTTQELSEGQAGSVFTMMNKYGIMAFKLEEMSQDDLDVLDSANVRLDDGRKSPSQRLRGVLYALYRAQSPEGENFEQFYVSTMEKILNHYKKQIDMVKLPSFDE